MCAGLLVDEHADERHAAGHDLADAPRPLAVAMRGLCGQKTRPIMSAPAATATAASSARVMPQILTTVTCSPHERRQERRGRA